MIGPILAILAGLLSGAGLVQGMVYSYPPYVTAAARDTFSRNPNMLPPLDTLISMAYKKQIGMSDYESLSKQIGFDSQISIPAFNAAKRLLDAGDYITLWRRGKIEESDLNESLSLLQMTDIDIANAKKVTEYFPSPLDLVRFAVREVYTEAIVETYGLKEDIPQTFITEGAKAGLMKDQAENYWASHWDLPSTTQGFEMLHRDIIKEDDLKTLLKTLDVMPYWRERLIQMSYNPLTRVDVRRIHAMGLLNDDRLYKAYKDIGYNHDNAEIMVNFTKAYNADEGSGLTRAIIIKSYKTGMITEAQLKDFLLGFGYAEDVANFWVDYTNYEIGLAKAESLKKEREAMYKAGAITADQLRQDLERQDLPSTYVDQAVVELDAVEVEKIKMPTRTDLTDWLKLEIIDKDYYIERMQEIGYRDLDIDFYLQELVPK